MAKFNIVWSDEEERRLMELRESGEDYATICKILNKEFKAERPMNEEEGKRYRRTVEQIKWQYHNVRKKNARNAKRTEGDSSTTSKAVKQRPKSKKKIMRESYNNTNTVNHDSYVSGTPSKTVTNRPPYEITVGYGNGNDLFKMHSNKELRTIMAHLAELI